MISQYDCDLSEATFKAKVCSSLYALFPMLMQRMSSSRPRCFPLRSRTA